MGREPRGQGGKIGNLPNQQPPRAPEIVPHEDKKSISVFFLSLVLQMMTIFSSFSGGGSNAM